MNRSEAEKFSGMITAMAATFSREADEAMLTGYKMGLDDLPIDVIARACKTAIRNCKFMPTVAELRQLAGVLSPEDRAVKAWQAFADANAKFGYYDTVNFDDPTINATVRSLGGWVKLSTVDDRREFDVFLRKDFERIYVSLYRNGISAEQAAPLIGFFDNHNCFHGHPLHTANQVQHIATDLPPAQVRIGARGETQRAVSEQFGAKLKAIGVD